MLRTHTCGELNKEYKDKEVVLCGWVHRRRDHGKLIFIDIRDRYGLTQIVFVPSVSKEAHDEAQKLGPEFVVKVTGTVNVRPEKNVNPDLSTGDMEVCATGLEILNSSEVPVFEVDDTADVSEELRLTYRYLDLRREKLLNSLKLRHKLCAVIHSFLDKQEFLEIAQIKSETKPFESQSSQGMFDF